MIINYNKTHIIYLKFITNNNIIQCVGVILLWIINWPIFSAA